MRHRVPGRVGTEDQRGQGPYREDRREDPRHDAERARVEARRDRSRQQDAVGVPQARLSPQRPDGDERDDEGSDGREDECGEGQWQVAATADAVRRGQCGSEEDHGQRTATVSSVRAGSCVSTS
ncbi:hypothetical protein GCM10022399_13770 [Terrabacter ginsenosidimutans]|uniref:Uncharacterized protein n=1 Tax=Terrabacter ginsenosidimutans TaxID=490575 RepID=A0ABP7D1K8_9MICO